ncbi:MAG: hypothetical protein PVH61_00410 [Candidatus Aminicenantes bacterium]|jgi:hypothetical protein
MIIDTNEHELAPEESAKGELLVYQTEDGTVKLEVRLENETIWLTQQMMAELFQTTKQNIGQHLKNIFEEGELEPNSVVKKFFTTAVEREIQRNWPVPYNKTNRKSLFHFPLFLVTNDAANQFIIIIHYFNAGVQYHILDGFIFFIYNDQDIVIRVIIVISTGMRAKQYNLLQIIF